MFDANKSAAQHSISCVIPFRNASSSIVSTLQALQQSSLPPCEVICVDDASTDDSCEKVQAFARRSSLHILCLPPASLRCGAAASRNSGARAASGTYLLFLDADVVVENDTIERLFYHIERLHYTAMVALYHDFSLRPGILAHFQAYMVNTVYCKLDPLHCPCLGTQCVLVQKQQFIAGGGFDEHYKAATVEDFEFGYRLRATGKAIGLATDARITHNHLYTPQNFWRNYYTKARDLSILLFTRSYIGLSSTGYHDISNEVLLLLFFLQIFCIVTGLFYIHWLLWSCSLLLATHILLWRAFIYRVALRWNWKISLLFFLLRTLVVIAGGCGVAVALLQIACSPFISGKMHHDGKR